MSNRAAILFVFGLALVLGLLTKDDFSDPFLPDFFATVLGVLLALNIEDSYRKRIEREKQRSAEAEYHHALTLLLAEVQYNIAEAGELIEATHNPETTTMVTAMQLARWEAVRPTVLQRADLDFATTCLQYAEQVRILRETVADRAELARRFINANDLELHQWYGEVVHNKAVGVTAFGVQLEHEIVHQLPIVEGE